MPEACGSMVLTICVVFPRVARKNHTAKIESPAVPEPDEGLPKAGCNSVSTLIFPEWPGPTASHQLGAQLEHGRVGRQHVQRRAGRQLRQRLIECARQIRLG